MTTFVLIRHGMTDAVSTRIAGRMPGVHLNAIGQTQVTRLAEHAKTFRLDAIYSGPLERARETAEPICRRLNLTLQIDGAFDEFECGDWTNRTFDELAPLPEWQRFNSFRSGTRAPNGESMLEVQVRALRKMRELHDQYQIVAIVSHGDVLRAIVVYFLGMPLDFFDRVEISPASISVLELSDFSARVRLLNRTFD